MKPSYRRTIFWCSDLAHTEQGSLRDAKNRDRVVQPLYKLDSGLEIGIGAAIVLFVDIRDVRTARVADASSED